MALQIVGHNICVDVMSTISSFQAIQTDRVCLRAVWQLQNVIPYVQTKYVIFGISFNGLVQVIASVWSNVALYVPHWGVCIDFEYGNRNIIYLNIRKENSP